jgi:REP element-mobilizing transposase RayT
MALHSYSRCWVHLIWGTLNREKILNKDAAARVSRYLHEYAETKNLYMKINYVNADHVHILVDLPTGLSIEEVAQLLKAAYIAGQGQHHRVRTFAQEFKEFIHRHGLHQSEVGSR